MKLGYAVIRTADLPDWEPADPELAKMCRPCRRCETLFGYSVTEVVDGVPSHVCAEPVRWEAERAEIAAIAGPMANGAREFQNRMIADVLKGEAE